MTQASEPGHSAVTSGISLLTGWLPVTATWVGAAVVAAAIVMMVAALRPSGRDGAARSGVIHVILAAAAAAVGVDWLVNWSLTDQGVASTPAPIALWAWIAALSACLTVTALSWSHIQWTTRSVGMLGISAALIGSGLAVNLWVGYFPTVQEAWSQLTAAPLPDQVASAQLPSLSTTSMTPTNSTSTGKVVAITTPDTISHFPHRTEYVYLPPAWFNANRPTLPVVMMLGGEFSTPTDWIRAADAVHIADTYASNHAGIAPILVFADSTGSFRNDTECVDGPRGNAAQHLTEELRPYVINHFDTAPSAHQWGVVGWSTGGTCAIDLAVTHPELFSTFEDIQGDLTPNAGDFHQTLARLYGGNLTAWAAFDPLTVMAHHSPYSDSAGWFDNSPPPDHHAGPRSTRRGPPSLEEQQAAQARTLCAAATAHGITCTLHTQPGGHTWQFASLAFTTALPWLTQHLTSTPPPATSPPATLTSAPAPGRPT